MSQYTAPHRATGKRSLSRRARIVLLASLLVPVSLIAIANIPASAAAKYATIQDIQDAITAALAPIQSAISSLQTQQANQASQISSLQNSTGKQLRAYDANGAEIGLLMNHGSENTGVTTDTIYSTTLNRFIYLDQIHIANNFYGFDNEVAALFQTSDCTGTPYDPTTGGAHAAKAYDMMPFSPTKYYIFNDSEQPSTITTGSQGIWDPTSNQLKCVTDIRTNIQAYELHQVNLPFPAPVVFPLQYKYQ